MRFLPLAATLLAADVGQTRPAIIGGSASDATDDATVLLFHHDPATNTGSICTAVLVAPRLVLTARHCVAKTDEEVACSSDGTPAFGAAIQGNHEASNLYVFTGPNRPAFVGPVAPPLDPTKWQPAARGAEIIDDGATTLCNHDLALVLLADPIANAPIATLRLNGDARAGEKLLTVGWGMSSTEVEPARRQRRDGVTVQRVGPNEASPALTPSEFLFDESICIGDSGGPVFAATTNAVVGVVSRGGNGLSPDQGGPAATCPRADNLATKLGPFRGLVERAFERAGATPRLEPEEDDESCLCDTARRRQGHRGIAGGFAAIVMTALLRRRSKRK